MAKRRAKTILLKRKEKNKTIKVKEKFICHYSYCKKELSNKKILKTHLKIHTARERNYKCSHCDKAFLSQPHLDKHETVHNDRKRAFPCTNCKRRFLTKVHLNAHMERCLKRIETTISSEINNYICPTCQRGYKSEKLLKYHERKIHIKREHNFLCSVCSKAFLYKGSMERHVLVFHKSITTVKKNPYWCRTCGQYFMSKKNLEKHKLFHKKTYDCIFCTKKLVSEEKLKEHEIFHTVRNLSEEYTYVCTLCNSKFKSGEELTKHTSIHDNDKNSNRIQRLKLKRIQREKSEKSFICIHCDKHFKLKSTFNFHMIKHKTPQKVKNNIGKTPKNNSKTAKLNINAGEQSICCSMCQKTFARKNNLTKHMKLHSVEKKVFTCHICDKIFSTENNLETHARIHLDVEESYLCSECLKIFASRANLNDHIKSVHVEKKMYSCPLCPLQFAAKNVMTKHFLSHRNEEDFSCPHCPRYYGSQEDMNWHIIKSHQDIVHKLSYKDEFYYHLRILEEDPKNIDKEEPNSTKSNESIMAQTNCLQECLVMFKHQYSYSGINDQPLKLWL